MGSKRLKPFFLEDGRYACPVCKQRDALKIADYGLARPPSKGRFWFLVQCRRCQTEFKVTKDI